MSIQKAFRIWPVFSEDLLGFLWRLTEGLHHLRRVARNHSVRRHIGYHHRSTSDDRSLADRHSRHDDRIHADKTVVLQTHGLQYHRHNTRLTQVVWSFDVGHDDGSRGDPNVVADGDVFRVSGLDDGIGIDVAILADLHSAKPMEWKDDATGRPAHKVSQKPVPPQIIERQASQAAASSFSGRHSGIAQKVALLPMR